MLISENRIHRVSVPRRAPLTMAEWSLVVLTFIWFLVATWVIGAVHPKAQLALLGISIVIIVVALCAPYNYENSRTIRYQRLLRFPIFWLGLTLFAYITIQWVNPVRTLVVLDEDTLVTLPVDVRGMTGEEIMSLTEGEFDNLPTLDRLNWLPHSIHAPFADRNPARVMVIWGSVWLVVCALWVGITRRRSLHMLLLLLTVNACMFAVVAILQVFYEADKILWMYESPAISFIGTFIYRGHGAAFMNCGTVIALGMFFHYGKVRKSSEQSGFILIYIIAALLLSVGVLASGSRMGIICGGILWLLFLIAFIQDWVTNRWTSPAKVGTCVLGAAAILLVVFVFGTDRFERSLNRFNHLDDISTNMRFVQNKATMEMIQDNRWLGVGAGSYRWAFFRYQDRYEEFKPKRWNRNGLSFPHAHNDILQPLAELGIFGILPLVGMIFFWGYQLKNSYRYLDRGLIVMTLGSMVLLLHAFTDPLFHSSAILGMWSLGFLAPAFAARLMRTRGISNLETT